MGGRGAKLTATISREEQVAKLAELAKTDRRRALGTGLLAGINPSEFLTSEEGEFHVLENGLRVGSDEWKEAAEYLKDDRLKLQYYGLSKVQWDDVQKDKGAIVDDKLLKDAQSRTITFTGQGEKDYVAAAEKKRADEAAAQARREFWTSPVTWAGIAGAVGIVVIFYMRS